MSVVRQFLQNWQCLRDLPRIQEFLDLFETVGSHVLHTQSKDNDDRESNKKHDQAPLDLNTAVLKAFSVSIDTRVHPGRPCSEIECGSGQRPVLHPRGSFQFLITIEIHNHTFE